MTKLLDKAIAEVREPPEREQDLAAESLRVFTELAKQGFYRLSPEERAAMEESKEQVRRGELATDEEVEAAFARFRA
ncbi:MAG: hypothetical protein ACT4QB_07115 [Gammaproteobacteria bacterium]